MQHEASLPPGGRHAPRRLPQARCPAPSLAQRSNVRTLRFIPEGNLANADPIWTTTTVARNHGYMIYDTLFGVDAAARPQPQMCSGYELSDDKLTWTFHLRDGLKFHDNDAGARRGLHRLHRPLVQAGRLRPAPGRPARRHGRPR